MKPSCSIVIRAYNEEEHISRLLSGISKQSLKDVQVILVDSGSTDSTVSAARQFGVEVVHIPPDDFTFGRSLNMGISAAKADLVVIASAHAYPVYPDWLDRLLAPFKDKEIALSYGKQRGNGTSKFSEQQIFRHWYPDHSEPRQTHPFCNNANAAIRRALWEKHPYDENCPGLEDLYWARWALEQGHTLAYVAEAEVIHVHSESWGGIFNRYRREAMAFKHLYPQEHFRLTDLMRLWAANSVSDLKTAAVEKKIAREWWGILRFRWMQFSGTYEGYRSSGHLTRQLKQTFYYPRPQPLHREKLDSRVKPIQYHDPSDGPA